MNDKNTTKIIGQRYYIDSTNTTSGIYLGIHKEFGGDYFGSICENNGYLLNAKGELLFENVYDPEDYTPTEHFKEISPLPFLRS